jgi:hypothetical protein
MRASTRSLLLASVILFSVACGSDKTSDMTADGTLPPLDLTAELQGELTVETEVDPAEVEAGENFTVTCYVEDESGPVTVLTEVVVVGGDAEVILASGNNVFERIGEYELACRTLEAGAIDESPAELKVTIGKIIRIETSLDKPELNAGDIALTTCLAYDAFDNTEEVEPGIVVDPVVGLLVEGQSITGETPGAYVVTCNGEKGVEVTSADLTVVEGVPYKYTATATPETVKVGEMSEVSCAVEDDQGNPVLADWKVQAPAEVTATGIKIFSTVADTHKIKCAPVEPTGEEKLVAGNFTVEPGPPVEMLVYPKPDKANYCMTDPVQIKHDLVDEYGNIVEEALIDPIVIVPTEGLEFQPNKTDKFIFAAEGNWHLEVQATDYEYSGEVDLLCDCTGPQITITYPPRGITLTGADSNIVVTGYVEDAVSPVTGLTINDEAVDLDNSNAFAFPTSLGHGMNLLKAESTDSLDNTARRFRSPFYSTKFFPADTLSIAQAMVPKAIPVFLSQDFIDDGDHSLPADDLATIVEQMLGGFDFAGLLPEEGIEIVNTDLTVMYAYITGVELGQPTLMLESVDGGIHLVISIPDLVVELDIEACFPLPFNPDNCQSSYGFIYADFIVADAYLFINVAEDGTVDAALGPIEVEFEGLDVDIQGLVGALFDPLVNTMVNIFKETIITELQNGLGAELPAMVKEALEGLTEGTVVELPPLIGNGDPTELTLGLNFALLQFTYDGLDLILDAALTAMKGVTHNPLGVLARDGCMGAEPAPFVLSKDDEMDAGIAVDWVNEALYSIWYSGAITLTLGQEDLADLDLSAYGIENLSLSTDLTYAPVLQSCGTGDAMELQLGDAFIHAEFYMMAMNWDMDIYLYLVMEATPSVMVDEETGNSQIGIEIGELKIAEVDVVEVRQDLVGKEDMVENLFSGVILPALMDQILSGLGGFDIPSFDLSGLSETIPEGTAISVDLSELALKTGYLVLKGKLK